MLCQGWNSRSRNKLLGLDGGPGENSFSCGLARYPDNLLYSLWRKAPQSHVGRLIYLFYASHGLSFTSYMTAVACSLLLPHRG